MLLADPGVVKLMAAYVLAVRLPIPPPWLFLLGSSSGGKSMLLNSLAKVKGYYSLDDLSSNSFISGARSSAGETSLLFELPRHGFLVFKDFTTILSKQKEQRAAIIGLLRKIYDGEFDRKTGNMASTQRWEGKIGVLGGSTSSFYTKMGDFSDMGERTLAYKFQQPEKRTLGMKIFDDGIRDDEAKKAMREGFKNYLDNENFNLPQEATQLPKFDRQTQEDILDLADLTTQARSSVERNMYDYDQSITAIHYEEQIARFQKEIMAMSYGFMFINQHDTGSYDLLPEDKRTLYNIALDTIPLNRRLVMVQVTKMGGSTTVKNICQYLGLDQKAVKLALGDMHAHKIFTFHQSHAGDVWEIKPKWAEIIKKFEYMDLTPETPAVESSPDLTQEETLALTESNFLI